MDRERDEPPSQPSTATVSRRRSVLATLSGSTAVTIIVAVQALVLAPLFLRELGPSLYGGWLASGELLVWLQAFDLGLPNLLIQRIGAAHGRGDSRTVGEYLASGLLVLGSIAVFVGVVAVILAPWVPPAIGITGHDANLLGSALALAGVASAATLATNAAVGFARGVQLTGMISAVTIASVLVGFAVTLLLLLAGWGLWAAALGLAARACVVVAGASVFVIHHLRRGLSAHFHVRRATCLELLSISPVTALGGLAYAGMHQSETALVAALGRPDLAAAYALTRRAADLARALIDMIGAAAYGSFAHLVASKQRERSLEVHAEISSARLSLAVVAAGTYIAVNAPLVGAWVGPDQYLGLSITFWFALQMLVSGQGYLLNYLYRATGAVASGSWMLLVEALVRVPLMVLLFQVLGVLALPGAAVATSAAFGTIAWAWTRRRLVSPAGPRAAPPIRLNVVRASVLVAGCLIGLVLQQPSWAWAVLVAMVFPAVTLPVLLSVDRRLSEAWSSTRSEITSAARVFSR